MIERPERALGRREATECAEVFEAPRKWEIRDSCLNALANYEVDDDEG